MRSVTRTLILGLLALAFLPAAAGATGPATTTPGVVYRVDVIIKDAKLTVDHTRYQRGALIRYHVTNLGRREYRFVAHRLKSPGVRPWKMVRVLVPWDIRGRYVYKTQVRRGGAWRDTGFKGFVTVY